VAAWIVIGVLDAAVLAGFRLLGGFGAAAGAFKEWGCAMGRIGDSGDCS
jgi:hypothetical protein